MSPTATLAPPLGRLLFTVRLLVQGNPALGPGLLATIGFVAMAGSRGRLLPERLVRLALLTLALLVATVVAVRGPASGSAPDPGRRPAHGRVRRLAVRVDHGGRARTARRLDGANRDAVLHLRLDAVRVLALEPARRPARARHVRARDRRHRAVGAAQGFNRRPAPATSSDGRFVEPAGYINANVAMWTIGHCSVPVTWPRPARRTPTWGLFLGGAGLLSCVALLGQSRGWLVAVPLAVLIFVAVQHATGAGHARDRAGGGSRNARGPGADPAVDPRRLRQATIADQAARRRHPGHPGRGRRAGGRRAARGSPERRRLRPARTARARRSRASAGAAVAIVLRGGAPASSPSPATRYTACRTRWAQFKRLDNEARPRASRASPAGTNRYDFWTVAWDLFEDQPLRGIGADELPGRTTCAAARAASSPATRTRSSSGVLAQTGLVGALLLLGAMAALAVAAVRALRARATPGGRGGGRRGRDLFAYWLAARVGGLVLGVPRADGPGPGDARPGRRPGSARQVPGTPSRPAPGRPPDTGPGRRGRRRRRRDRRARRPVDVRTGDRPGGGSVAHLARGGVHAPGPRAPAQPARGPARPGRGHDRAAPRTARPGRARIPPRALGASPRTPTRCSSSG